jgi:hypothetical protein
VASYEVTYGEGSLSFSPVISSGVYGPEPTPEGAAVAEAVLSVCPFLSLLTNYP